MPKPRRSPDPSRPRIRKVAAADVPTPATAIEAEPTPHTTLVTLGPSQESFAYPSHWQRGQFLDVQVRSDGAYIVLLGEKNRTPERALTIPNKWDAQMFVSWWYAKDYAGPRAG